MSEIDPRDLDLQRMDGTMGPNECNSCGCECDICDGRRIEALTVDRDRLREALRAVLFEVEFARNGDQTQHFYSTCEEGRAINAGRDCVLCTAHAALEGEP